jgi:hypothetical protein
MRAGQIVLSDDMCNGSLEPIQVQRRKCECDGMGKGYCMDGPKVGIVHPRGTHHTTLALKSSSGDSWDKGVIRRLASSDGH